MKTTVLSDGGWGTALALRLVENGHDVVLWGPFPDYLAFMRNHRINPRYLPGCSLPSSLCLEEDLGQALADAEVVVLASPSQYLRGVLEQVGAGVSACREPLFVNVAKGIEVRSLHRMSEVVAEVLGPVRYAVLSGPSHAEEVARGVPTAVVAASCCVRAARQVQALFLHPSFRVYTSDDVVGVELGGALKNVLALAVGMCDGMQLGDNPKAALMTRGLVEMARFGVALGGRAETFSGLSGTGDLIVTCLSRHSRNRHVGEQLGRGRPLAEIVEEMGGKVAEGVTTAESAYRLAQRLGTESPIIEQVHAVLYEGRDPAGAVEHLMTREPRPEQDGQGRTA